MITHYRTPDTLACLPRFVIHNKHAKVEFIGSIDVLGLDLDKIVMLEYMLVEFPDNELIADRYGLDKSILVTLYNFEIANKDPQEVRTLVGKYLYKKLAELVEYDHRNQKLQYKFTSTTLF